MLNALLPPVNQRWRTFVIFRFVSLAGLLAQLLRDGRHHEHRTLAWVLFACVFGWSMATGVATDTLKRPSAVNLPAPICKNVVGPRAALVNVCRPNCAAMSWLAMRTSPPAGAETKGYQLWTGTIATVGTSPIAAPHSAR